jgi:hypothetical protein
MFCILWILSTADTNCHCHCYGHCQSYTRDTYADSHANNNTHTDTDTDPNTDQYIWHCLLLLGSGSSQGAKCEAHRNWYYVGFNIVRWVR